MAKNKKKKMDIIKINIYNSHPILNIKKSLINKIIKLICLNEQQLNAEINIIFVDHQYIIDLNKEFMDKNLTTDVLSFPLNDNDSLDSIDGEIYINLDQIAQQALEYSVTFFNEMNRIIIHGILHLLGYKDKTSEEKNNMTQKEDYYLKSIKEVC